MYEQHFGLTEKPFSILPDPKFLYFSKQHRIAYAMLEYGLLGQAGFTVVSGPIGSGKTSLVQKLVHSIPGTETTLGLISTSSLTEGPLLEWVLMSFGQRFEDVSLPRLHRDFMEFLTREADAGRRVLLIIDEAQNLSVERLEELRMLSNLNVERMLIQLVLVGQPELREKIADPRLKQFSQRVSSDFHLQPLTEADMPHYFSHRLAVSGRDKVLFTRPALKVIYEAAGGVPRSINVLADKCLVYAFAENATRVGRRTVERVLEDEKRYGSLSRMNSDGMNAAL